MCLFIECIHICCTWEHDQNAFSGAEGEMHLSPEDSASRAGRAAPRPEGLGMWPLPSPDMPWLPAAGDIRASPPRVQACLCTRLQARLGRLCYGGQGPPGPEAWTGQPSFHGGRCRSKMQATLRTFWSPLSRLAGWWQSTKGLGQHGKGGDTSDEGTEPSRQWLSCPRTSCHTWSRRLRMSYSVFTAEFALERVFGLGTPSPL